MKPRILLIDDEANQGWKETVEKVFFNGDEIDAAITKEEAVAALDRTHYDLIFLDLRFGENDHQVKHLEKFQGYEILTSEIRGGFDKVNFTTPVILFTASNKIWNIHGMLEAGADDFYIKEHPDQATDIEFSRQNFIRLTKQIPSLIALGVKRQQLLTQVNEIIALIATEIYNQNIRERIAQKLKIGFTTLFHRHSAFEQQQFAFSQELMAYICFWSILEEITKDGFQDNWIKSGANEGEMAGGNWRLRNGEPFIENLTYTNSGVLTGHYQIELIYDAGAYKKQQRFLALNDPELGHYQKKIGLPLQVYAQVILGKNWSASKAKTKFHPLVQFRNQVDFIHSSVGAIFNKNLNDVQDKTNAFNHCVKMLDFIKELLASPWTS
ncbi:response regulator [Pedobacter aquatilis]|uniref:response regulator n=1 Tax=Pedobacter aquatilis TaxID=351343 RepID=UPI00292E9793|nr:response regulator [Pedobacter aquatilis]